MYIYVDYIQIHTITIHNDLLCMDGAYQDPVTTKLKFTYFESDFNYFYNFLAEHEFDNSELALDSMATSLSGKSTDTIDLRDKFIELHSMVFRLTTMVDPQDEGKEAGFFIEDGYVLEEGCFSFQQYLHPPSFDGNDRARKVKLLRTYKTMSGHLAALALRYAYYQCQIKREIPEHIARSQASLQDDGVYLAAKAAFDYISLGPSFVIDSDSIV